jgi:hypothetical protein
LDGVCNDSDWERDEEMEFEYWEGDEEMEFEYWAGDEELEFEYSGVALLEGFGKRRG